MRPDHRRLETAARGGLSDYPVTPSKEPGSAGEAVIGLEPVGRDCPGSFHLSGTPRFAQTDGRPLRWPLMTEDGKPLEILLEDAARARRLAIVLDGDPAALELEQYAEEVEAEIHRRAAGDWGQ